MQRNVHFGLRGLDRNFANGCVWMHTAKTTPNQNRPKSSELSISLSLCLIRFWSAWCAVHRRLDSFFTINEAFYQKNTDFWYFACIRYSYGEIELARASTAGSSSSRTIANTHTRQSQAITGLRWRIVDRHHMDMDERFLSTKIDISLWCICVWARALMSI